MTLIKVFLISLSYEPNSPTTIEMGAHLTAHGYGVKDVAFAVEDLEAILERARKKGVKVVKDVWEEEDEVIDETCKVGKLWT